MASFALRSKPGLCLESQDSPRIPARQRVTSRKKGVLAKRLATQEWSNGFAHVGRVCRHEFVRVLLHVLIVFCGHKGLKRSIHHLTQCWVNMDRVANRLVRTILRI